MMKITKVYSPSEEDPMVVYMIIVDLIADQLILEPTYVISPIFGSLWRIKWHTRWSRRSDYFRRSL